MKREPIVRNTPKKWWRAGGLYVIRNLANGRMYYGSTTHFASREYIHWNQLRRGAHDNRALQADYNALGRGVFDFCVLAVVDITVDRGTPRLMEQRLLGRVLPDSSVYNVWMPVGWRPHEISSVTRERLSRAHRGKVIPPEARANMSVAAKARKASPETKAKMSAAGRGRRHTAESRAKMSAARKGRKLSLEHAAKCGAAVRGRKWSPEERLMRQGRGSSRHLFTREVQAKSIATRTGRKRSGQALENIRAAAERRRGRVMPAEQRAKISAANKGRPKPPGHAAKVSAALKAYHRQKRDAA